jgi:hypothetical protein
MQKKPLGIQIIRRIADLNKKIGVWEKQNPPSSPFVKGGNRGLAATVGPIQILFFQFKIARKDANLRTGNEMVGVASSHDIIAARCRSHR